MSNVYYNPEHFGLEIVAEVQQPNMSYEFNIFAIWIRKEDGALFYGQDSGCSCPSPFEKVQYVDYLYELKDMHSFASELRSWGDSFLDAQEIQSVVEKVELAKLYKSNIFGSK